MGKNESNASRLWGQPSASPYVKDSFHQYIISGSGEAINPAKVGIRAAREGAGARGNDEGELTKAN